MWRLTLDSGKGPLQDRGAIVRKKIYLKNPHLRQKGNQSHAHAKHYGRSFAIRASILPESLLMGGLSYMESWGLTCTGGLQCPVCIPP